MPELHFKSGVNLPKLESKKYLLKSISFKEGTIDDVRLNILSYKKDNLSNIPRLLRNFNGFKELNNVHTEATCLEMIDLTNTNNTEIEITLLDSNVIYDFVIGYDIL